MHQRFHEIFPIMLQKYEKLSNASSGFTKVKCQRQQISGKPLISRKHVYFLYKHLFIPNYQITC